MVQGRPTMQTLSPLTLDDARARFSRLQSRYRTVNGVDLHRLEDGLDQAPLTVVMLPGQWLSAFSTDAWSRVLAARYRVIRLDLPGHGLAGPFPDDNYGPQAYAHLLGEAMRAIAPGPHVVVGTSFSGIPAALYAATAPEGLRALVLATSSGLRRPPGGPQPNVVPDNADWAKPGAALPRSFYAWKLGTLLRRDMAEDERDALIDEIAILNELPGRAAERDARVRDHDPAALVSALPGVAVPLLVQWSSHSTYLPPAMADDIAELAGGPAEIHHYPETGHLLLADAPEDTALDLLHFLERLA
jgi:pimeloyl-ACP methyl ester carboxylesterase